MKNKILVIIILVLFAIGCTIKEKEKKQLSYTTVTCVPFPPVTDEDWYKTDKKAPLFTNLGDHEFVISTENELIQKYFNQGLILAYGFNHAEAARSFYYASKLDPKCAMAYWGYAYVVGPNYNAGMAAENYPKAFSAILKAIELSENATPKERALINALATRYTIEPPEDRYPLDVKYSEEMKKVFEAYPGDTDVGTLYAEAQMNLHPWDLYDKTGKPKEWTPEIVAALDQVLEIDPKHPGANHFYIHAVEASADPGQGLYSAKLYDEGLVPGVGHLVHMPSHIYIRTGDYHKGTRANINAVASDSSYTTTCHAQGVYPLAYYPHNYHFLAATATLEGNSKWGIDAAEKVSEQVNIQLMQEPGWSTLQHFYTIPYYVYVKFAKWDKILEMPEEKPSLTYPCSVRAYARGMAFLGKKDIISAKKELEQIEDLSKDETLKELTIFNINSLYDLVIIAKDVLNAEILASEENYDEAISLLKKAIKAEDNLNYNEPPDWFFSVRHNLGSVQIEAQKYEDAIQTFEDDLKIYPKNGWALHGLQLAYSNLDDKEAITEIGNQLTDIWATADVDISNARIK